MRGPSNNALLSLDLEDHLCDLGVLNKFVDFLSCDTIISKSSKNFMGLLMLNVSASRPSSGAVLQ